MAEPKSAQGQPPQAELSQLLRSPDLLKLLDYWRSKRCGRAMPSRKDIDPIEIPWALSRIFLVDYDLADGFHYRLAGAEVAAAFGRGNMKGLRFSDFFSPERVRSVEQRWMPLVTHRSIAVMTGMIYLAADRSCVGERLLMPLAETPDGPVTGILGMAECELIAGALPREVQLSQVEYLPVTEIP